MPRHSYRERDYPFGQAMFKLRTSIGLTQAGLAAWLRVSRRAVAEWEGGSNYPKAHHLQQVLELCVQQQVFAPGREAEEIRALGKRRINGCSSMRVGSRPYWPGRLPHRPRSKKPRILLR